MRKTLTVTTLLLFALGFAFPVAASYPYRGQGVRERVATRVAERRVVIQQTVEELRQHSQQLREERRLHFSERQATKRAEIATKVAELKVRVIERIKEIFATILDRMLTALGRLDKIVDRINARIAKLEAAGVDTTSAQNALASCSDEQATAQRTINAAKEKVAAVESISTTVRNAVQQANAAMRDGKRALQNYHKCLVNVIRTLKAVAPKEGTESAR